VSGLGRLIRRLVMKTSVPPVDLRAGECWWCGGPADSREHRYKRSDLKREHGKGGYSGDAVLSRISDVRSVARSSKSDILKFPSSMCQPCNNTRSQPFDDAYDALIEHLWANERTVLTDKQLDLGVLWGSDQAARADDVLRYFVKHICCRIAEYSEPGSPKQVPADLIAFLDGGSRPASLSYDMFMEPVQVVIDERMKGDPLAARWLGVDPLFVLGPGSYSGAWRYGPLTFVWWVNSDVQPGHQLGEAMMPLPLIASQFDVRFEFAMSAPEGLSVGDEQPPLFETPGFKLRCTQFLLAGFLDTQWRLSGRPVDERRNTRGGLDGVPVDEAGEHRRVRELVASAAAWASGELGKEATVRARRSAPTSTDEVVALAAALADASVTQSDVDDPVALAAVSAGLLAEGEQIGLDDIEAQNRLLDSAWYAGACLAAAGHTAGRREDAYRSAAVA
jgi:hypothetical protein